MCGLLLFQGQGDLDVRNVGSIVTYSWEVYRNGNFLRSGDGDEMMQVEDSKIVYWENQHR